MKQNKKITITSTLIEKEVRELQARLAAKEKAKKLLDKAKELYAKGAEGTGDYTEAANAASQVDVEELRKMIEAHLRKEPTSFSTLMDQFPDLNHKHINAALGWVRRKFEVVNLGSARRALWHIETKDEETSTPPS